MSSHLEAVLLLSLVKDLLGRVVLELLRPQVPRAKTSNLPSRCIIAKGFDHCALPFFSTLAALSKPQALVKLLWLRSLDLLSSKSLAHAS